ncbi:zinc-dependent metalloprotease [Pleomorphovibrio marinus]|uniref:zinc-dependent metalloprotease n=1 Tax=Pleomorphovibrio marinus TaxID=2164132 RepID=UPI000E0ABCF2|nr:zinc-dependent metalloprotease [Pleomorphovibrio marinus]
MIKTISNLICGLILLMTFPLVSGEGNFSVKAQKAPEINSFTNGMEKMPGFIPLYWDGNKGKLYLEIEQLDQELLYYPSLAAGLGSNDIGLDRGRVLPSHVVEFKRSGNKVLMIEPNLDYRALTDNEMEKKAVEESFARSVHWGFDIVAVSGDKVLVDGTPFFLQDAVNAAGAISRTRQGNFKIDPSRCALYLPRTKNFPKNTEVEATITLTGDQPGNYLRDVTPTPTIVSLRMHHSFVELPDDNYTPRGFDPRAGINAISFFDYASPVNQPITKRYIRRHRLEKVNPGPEPSEVKEPIVYYIDPGTPEPIRTALMDGTKWWAEAFEEAGFKNAFRVELLPEDADPMDIRYHLVQWVHRSTRGWSYGGGVTDPRTGEIIKGKVTLGSLRVRQDYLLAQGLVGEYELEGEENPAMMELALARMRQLAAHEVGHTLGLPHNYIASTYGRASVMDYPHPTVHFDENGEIDISDSYAEGIGEWDKVSIKIAYGTYPEDMDEMEAIDQLVKDYQSRGMTFLADQDARPPGSAHPQTHLWDNGEDAVEELHHTLKIREKVLADFSDKKIPKGTPMANLEEVLVPMYMYHRYQVEAAAKVLAGASYTYMVRGESGKPIEPVSSEAQQKALEALLLTLDPAQLKVPTNILTLIPPRSFQDQGNPRELFNRKTGILFDPLAPAEIAAHHTLTLLLHPERASRLVTQHALESSLPGLDGVIDALLETTWKKTTPTGYEGEVKRTVDKLVIQHLVNLSTDQSAATQARAIAMMKLNDLSDWMGSQQPENVYQKAHLHYSKSMLDGFAKSPDKQLDLLTPIPAPSGAPIGTTLQHWLEPICTHDHSE